MNGILPLASFVTDLADEAVLLPLAAGIVLLFAVSGWLRGAVAWVLTVGATLGATLVLKLVLLSCGSCWFGPTLNSPSGHTAGATMVYGGLLVLLRRGSGVLSLCCLAGVALLIGGSRLVLNVHSPAEVILGGAVGLAGAATFVWVAGPAPERVRWWQAAAVCGVGATALHGLHMPAEAAIRHVARGLWFGCQVC